VNNGIDAVAGFSIIIVAGFSLDKNRGISGNEENEKCYIKDCIMQENVNGKGCAALYLRNLLIKVKPQNEDFRR